MIDFPMFGSATLIELIDSSGRTWILGAGAIVKFSANCAV